MVEIFAKDDAQTPRLSGVSQRRIPGNGDFVVDDAIADSPSVLMNECRLQCDPDECSASGCGGDGGFGSCDDSGAQKDQSPKYAKRAGRNRARAPGCIYTQALLPEAEMLLHPQSLARALKGATSESRKGRSHNDRDVETS